MSTKIIEGGDLADRIQVTALWALFSDYFERVNAENITLDTSAPAAMDSLDAGGDLGVGKYAKTSDLSLMAGLQFMDGRPANWNPWKHDNTSITPWDGTNRPLLDYGAANVKPLALLWHQLVGVTAMAEHMWGTTPAADIPGMVLADGVGIGKTAQVMAVIALTQQVWMAERNQQPRPALLSESPHARPSSSPAPPLAGLSSHARRRCRPPCRG